MFANRRLLLTAGIAFAVVAGLVTPAAAASGPRRLQRLAVAQTQLLFRDYHGQPQTVSPRRCNEDRVAATVHGVLMLPTLSFGSGNVTLRCHVTASTVLLDLGGFIPTEDARGDTYTLADGTVLDFERQNLQAICNDVVQYVPDVPATLDGNPITGTPVVTRNFRVQINRSANNTPGNPFYQDSIDLGHPGSLTSCYAGKKVLLHLSRGHHVVSVDLSAIAVAPTVLVYDLRVD